MSNKLLTLIALSAAIAFGSTSMARADCEADLGLLEAALAAPALTAEAKATLEAAGAVASKALRKDDDEGCNKAVMDALASVGATPAPAKAAAAAGPAIGDLKPIRAIAQDTLTIVKAGDLAKAKTRIKDLETAWDESAKAMRAANAGTWDTVDKAIDTALKQLRAGKPTAAGSADALTALIGVIDKAV